MKSIHKLLKRAFAAGLILPLAALLLAAELSAAGIQDIAPTAADAPVMLDTGRPGFGVFADFNGPEPGRLVVSIGRADETVFFGLAPEYQDTGVPFNDNNSRYSFRVRQLTADGTNPVVHGPFTISNTNANVNSYEDAAYGVYDTTLTVAGRKVFVFRPGTTGDFSIEFDDIPGDGNQRVSIPFWDFTVVRDGAVVPGRVWSRGWAFRLPQVDGTQTPECVWDREFNGRLYSYTEDGFVSLIDFQDSGFQGLSFNMAFNSVGPGQTGNIAEDRMSIPGVNATNASAQHRIFLSLPDIELFPDGECGMVTAAETFRCDENAPYCLDVSVTRPGLVEILLDFNGNGVLDDNGEDVSLIYEFVGTDTSACIPWNGLRGDSTPVRFTDTVDVIINYSQGIQHWSAYDVEYMRNGFCVQTVRPLCSLELESTELYWDDREIPQLPGTGAIKDNRNGNDCMETPRSWDFFDIGVDSCSAVEDELTTGYGDKNTLNTWWFANSQAQFRARVPVVNAAIVGPTRLCSGDTSALTARNLAAIGPTTFAWSGPGVDTATTATVRVTLPGEYCVVVTEENGCSQETCVTVSVFDFTSNQFPESLNTCFGTSVSLPSPGNPDFTYTWSPATGISSTSSNQPTFFPQDTTTYTVVISSTNAEGITCEVTETITINVAPEINLQVIGGGPICDATTTFTASTNVPAEIVLFDPNGVAIGTGTTFTVPVSGESDYLLVATDAQNCTDTITFTVSGGPVEIALPDTLLACTSDGVSVGVTNLDLNDTLSYLWSPANLFDPATLTSANPTFVGGPGDYTATVVATNQYGCTATEDIQIILIDDSGTLSFTEMVDCDGSTVRFTNTSTVTFGYRYDFGDGTTSTEANPTHVYAAPGTYTVTLSLIYDQECVSFFTREVTTFDAVLVAGFSVGLGDCENGTTSINFTDNSLNVSGAALSYRWTFTGGTPTTSTEQNPTLEVNTSGEVTATLQVTSADNCVSSVDTSFTVDLAVVNLATEIIICPGEEAELNPGADTNLIYTWSPAPDFDPATPNPTTGIAGTYFVTVTSAAADFNCSNVDTVTLIVADSIGLAVNGPDGPIDGGDIDLGTVQTCGTPIELSVTLMTNDGVNVVFTDLAGNVIGTGSSLTINPSGRDTIVVTATNAFACVERDTVVIINNQVDAGINVGAMGLNFCSSTDTSVQVLNFDPNDTLTYAWEPNAIINGALDGARVDITSPAEGSVDLMVTVANQFGCDTMLTVTVTSTPFMPNTYPELVAPCFGQSFTIDGGAAVAGYVYEWNPADGLDLSDPANPVGTFTEDGTLTVTITDPLTDCSSTQTITVDVAPEIAFTATPADTAVCEPTMVSVTGSTVNPDVVIVWFDDAGLTNQVGTGTTYTVDAAEPGQSYQLFGQATDTITGCSEVVPVTINVSGISLGLPLPNVTACPGERPQIFGEVRPLPTLQYTYSPANAIDNSDPTAPVFVGEVSGPVTVTVTDLATGCSATVTIEATVVDFDGLTGTADPAEILLGESSTLTVEGCEGECAYEWMIPNGTIDPATGPVVTATPDAAGNLLYEIQVTRDGCTDDVQIELRVEDPICDADHIYVPNAFTPNGDNENDVMQVRSRFAEELTEFRFIIYNRWGQEVYSSDNIFDSWDGTIGGDDLEPDVYGYYLRVLCPAGQELIQKGNITILR
ncbi:PKD domain-containing protein [Neolewinella lacunae]|uniref:Gliding motility-associated C-terminal domain-containing protein n=1 Tax=Neolewinella lacunae TaxID=1517758 RepID=A0A923PFT6_9BACT|nr:PKD domain-containing protein [Neolewinella lacunae]MBC6993338.1 gliding motility-associated C-terminal domain-containing protein [Neolewinella lacunae]MDN3636328.1 PKD domain-containing protein [Neolewinella lacunae]